MRRWERPRRDEISDGAILAALVRSGLVATEQEGSTPTGERYRVVIEHCPGCSRTVSPEAEVSDTILAEALCDAELLDMRVGDGVLKCFVTRSRCRVRARWVWRARGAGAAPHLRAGEPARPPPRSPPEPAPDMRAFLADPLDLSPAL